MSTAASEEQTLQKVTENMDVFVSLIGRVKDDEVRTGLEDLCEEIGSRIATCPASTNTKYIGAFPGGLVWNSLNVLKIMKELNKLYDANISSDSLILTALFHDIGKIGNREKEYYLPQESNWHAERGMVFEINSEIANIPVSTRSVAWLSSAGVPLSETEIHAITSLQNMSTMYSSELYNSPVLTLILQQAVRATLTLNKGKISVL